MTSDAAAPLLRLWVLAVNDGETAEIVRLLQSRGEHLLTSRQSWGASWANLEPEWQQQIRHFQAAHPGAPIYGIELAGPNPFGATDIDHHRYADADRSHALSSLEQVAAILKVKL